MLDFFSGEFRLAKFYINSFKRFHARTAGIAAAQVKHPAEFQNRKRKESVFMERREAFTFAISIFFF